MIYACVIPARYGSKRLPGKPLRLIDEKPMIQWVYEQAAKAKYMDMVIVATDHKKIFDTVKEFGGNAVMTSATHSSGTDRVAEAVGELDVDVVINVQGDEPFISPGLLDHMAKLFDRPEIDIATAVHRITDGQDLGNPNLVRVTRDKNHFALYFTRSVIPYFRDEPDQAKWLECTEYYKHIGLYAYRKRTLMEITKLPQSPLERAERLEQLRMLENGYPIYTLLTEYESICVDTEEDLIKVNKLLHSNRITLE